jgi:carbonic anhydrase
MNQHHGFIGRRNLLKLAGFGSAGLAVTGGSALWTLQQAVAPQMANADESNPLAKVVSSDEALKRLLSGNERFVQRKFERPDQSIEWMKSIAKAQSPFAAILGCADSRVPAEIIFDQGLGDLFVVRVAGNVASPTSIGSLEFATSVLGSQLIVVLGHRRCGAVSAAIKGDPLPGRMGVFVEEIKPSVETARTKSGDIQETAVIANVQYQVEQLAESSTILRGLIKQGKLKIVGGRYDLDTGKVTIAT